MVRTVGTSRWLADDPCCAIAVSLKRARCSRGVYDSCRCQILPDDTLYDFGVDRIDPFVTILCIPQLSTGCLHKGRSGERTTFRGPCSVLVVNRESLSAIVGPLRMSFLKLK